MIKISQSATYSAPVTAEIRSEDGKVNKVTFTAVFRRLKTEEIEELTERLKKQSTVATGNEAEDNDDSNNTPLAKMTDKQLVQDVMVGWGKDVMGDDGQPLEFNLENLGKLMSIHPVRPQIVKTFFETITGARVKN